LINGWGGSTWYCWCVSTVIASKRIGRCASNRICKGSLELRCSSYSHYWRSSCCRTCCLTCCGGIPCAAIRCTCSWWKCCCTVTWHWHWWWQWYKEVVLSETSNLLCWWYGRWNYEGWCTRHLRSEIINIAVGTCKKNGGILRLRFWIGSSS